MARILYCTKCETGYGSIAVDMPSVCPSCEQRTVWTTTPPTEVGPVLPWTAADRRLLRSFRIQAD